MAKSKYYKNLVNIDVIDDVPCTNDEKIDIPADVDIMVKTQTAAYLRVIRNCLVFMTVILIILLILFFFSLFIPS